MLLILVVSVLLLGAAEQKASPVPSTRPTEHQSPQVQHENKHGEDENTRSKNNAARLQPTQPIQFKPAASEEAYNYRKIERQLVALQKSSDRVDKWLVAVSAINVVAAFLIFCATRQAANAAEDSAKAANLALNVELPYVFLKSPKMVIRAESISYPYAIPSPTSNKLYFQISYELRNHGKGVAIIDGVRARFHLAKTQWDTPTSEERAREKTIVPEIRDRVIGPADISLNFITGLYLTPETWHKILPHKLELTFLGYVRFHDVFDRPYRQDFCFRYLVGSFDARTLEVQTDWFYTAEPKKNKHHQNEKTSLTEPK
ncbi:MAG TPA: hypothetical protein VMV15_15295 [Candidatus Binataceae bacterium]|nr:hypothetical protein [Candidatus Binataceae bacterium]